MAGEVNITDLEALEEFRRALIRFREEIGVALAEADSEVKSIFIWLERDRMLHWRRAIPKFEEQLTSARAALFRKEMQTFGTGERPSTIDEKKMVERCKQRVEGARERLEATKKWMVNLERKVSQFKGSMAPIAVLYDRELPDAILRIRNMTLAIEAYLATPTMGLAEQVERTRERVANMRRAGELNSPEQLSELDREIQELRGEEQRLASERDAALAALRGEGKGGEA